MSRLLVLGHAPLPHEPLRLQCAGNLRTWHFVKPLLSAGHEVRLVASRIGGSYPDDAPPEIETRDGRLHYLSVAPDLFHDRVYLQRHHDEFDPIALVGVNTYPSSRVVEIATERPIWCDLNGWIMAEGQTKAAIYQDDRYLSHFWNMERTVLDRADVISAVSQAQAHAVVGELAARGRLNRATVGYEFSRHIPNALVEVDYEHRFEVVRGKRVPADAFIVLWVGGYNTWTDVDLLYEALQQATSRASDIYFVSTGGILAGHDELTFDRFRERIEASAFRDRVHFAGWVPTEEVPSYYLEADLGINVDNENYETVFGARNRLNDMLKVGLPILTTRGTEIAGELERRGLVLAVEVGDAEGFAEKIVWARENRSDLRSMAQAASSFGREAYSYDATTRSLVEWAAAPERSPDLGRRVRFDARIDFFGASPQEPLADSPDAPTLEARCRDLEEQLEAIHGSKMWRLWMTYLRARAWFVPK